MSTSSNTQPVDRDLVVRLARGFFAETVDGRWCIGSASAMTGGLASYTAIGLYAGEKISSLTVYVALAGTGLTLSKVGLYSSSGAQLAVSADQGASWQTVGAKTIALTAPYTVKTNGVYYLAALATGTTIPSLIRGSGGTSILAFALAGFLSAYYGQTGLADLPAQATFTTGLTGAHCQWFGLS